MAQTPLSKAIPPTPIHDFLVKNAESENIRCYMPGHKGTESPYDITEIDGADSLYEADFFGEGGIIAQSEVTASRLFDTAQTLYSCSGSTLAIQTMLALAVKITDKHRIIAGRYSHRSFINTCTILNLTPVWAYPEEFLSAKISPTEIDRLLSLPENEGEVAAVFITSIDYYGGMADIAGIAKVCKKHKVLLLCDNAHGAYLNFLSENRHPIHLGANMCADSAHKTLPVLTGGAYLHIASKKHTKYAKEVMSLFGTSSPSYLILDSLDRCNRALCESPDKLQALSEKISDLKAELSAIGYTLSESDPLRITVDCAGMSTTGFILSEKLKSKGVICEYADSYRLVLLFGYGTTNRDAERIKSAFKQINPQTLVTDNLPPSPTHIVTNCVSSAKSAYFSKHKSIDISKAKGKICGNSVNPCPPGIPLLMPGEAVNDAAVKMLGIMGITNIDILDA